MGKLRREHAREFGLVFVMGSLVALAFSACTSIKVNQLDPEKHRVYHVCIKENPKVIVPDFPEVIERGLRRHGISSEVYAGKTPTYCEYHLTYTATKTWDLTFFLNHAEVRLYKDNQELAMAEYHLNAGGLFNLNKRASVGTKMDPVMDQLLEGYSAEHVDRYRKAIPAPPASFSTHQTEQLRKLKHWYEEGLITEQEYQSKRAQILAR